MYYLKRFRFRVNVSGLVLGFSFWVYVLSRYYGLKFGSRLCVLGYVTVSQTPTCTNSSSSSLSLDQFYRMGSPNGKITPAVLLPLQRQNKDCIIKFWKCQKVVSNVPHEVVSILPHESKQNTWFYMGGSGLDRTDDFQKLCGSRLDRIQLLQIRIGFGLKNFTVHSSLEHNSKISQSTHLWNIIVFNKVEIFAILVQTKIFIE